MKRRPPGKPLLRALVRPPHTDTTGRKGWFEPFAHAQPHAVRRLDLTIAGWPTAARPLRIAFLSDFHAGSHTGDLARLGAIISEAAACKPDLVLHGGDFVNMQMFGGGRLAPRAIAAVLARLDAPLGRFAVLGNHDYVHGPDEVRAALESEGIALLDDERRTLSHDGHAIDLIGLPDARRLRSQGKALLAGLSNQRATIVLTHDPFWFAHVPAGPHLTLAGHTHGGQVVLPFVGALTNASRAPLRWSYGLIEETGRRMYVTSGLGTSGIPLRIGMPPEYVILDISGSA